jgi:hypothetical protein
VIARLLKRVLLVPALACAAVVPESVLRFEPNEGEFPPDVRFVSRDKGCTAQFLDSGLVLRIVSGTNTPQELKVHFAGASSNLTVQSAGEGTGALVYSNVYPGIDVKYFGRRGEIEDDYILRIGADPADIRIVMEGASHLALLHDGTLIINTPAGQLEERSPMAYQEINGQHVVVECGFRRLGTNCFGFFVGRYDLRHELIIDPRLRPLPSATADR